MYRHSRVRNSRSALHVFWLSVPHFMCFGYPCRVSRVLVIRTAFRVFETACRRGLVKSYHSCVCGSYPNFRVFWPRVPRFMCLVPSTFKHVSFGTSLKFPFFVLQTHEFRDIAYFPFFGILTLACYRIYFLEFFCYFLNVIYCYLFGCVHRSHGCVCSPRRVFDAACPAAHVFRTLNTNTRVSGHSLFALFSEHANSRTVLPVHFTPSRESWDIAHTLSKHTNVRPLRPKHMTTGTMSCADVRSQERRDALVPST